MGYVGKLSSSKQARIARCSQNTAGRDIQDLVKKKGAKFFLSPAVFTNSSLMKFKNLCFSV